MKSYPSIDGYGKVGEDCFLFIKYDGSNLRFLWSKKEGWCQFGTRHRLFDESDEVFGKAISLFKETLADDLELVFKKNPKLSKDKEIIIFAEYFGHKSFAGSHCPEDEMILVPFDVNPMKRGFLSPKEFLDIFGHLKIAECVYENVLTEEIIEQIKNSVVSYTSKYPVKTSVFEGVISKGGSKHSLWMGKIKTEQYKKALQEKYKENWLKYW